MIKEANKLISKGKKSLNTLLKENAIEDVKNLLQQQNININEVSEEDLEKLVAQKVKDKKNKLEGVASGGVVGLLLSMLIGF